MLADTIVADALEHAPVSFKEDPDGYMKAVYPNDDPNGPMRGDARGYPDAKDKEGNPDPKKPQSACGLFYAATLLRAGCTHPALKKPYIHRNDIMTVLDSLAKNSGAACHPGKNDNAPFSTLKAGCGLYIGSGGLAHFIVVLTDPVVVEYEDTIRAVVDTAEGGKGAGNEVELGVRTLIYSKKTGVITVEERWNRQVNYWVDPDCLPA